MSQWKIDFKRVVGSVILEFLEKSHIGPNTLRTFPHWGTQNWTKSELIFVTNWVSKHYLFCWPKWRSSCLEIIWVISRCRLDISSYYNGLVSIINDESLLNGVDMSAMSCSYQSLIYLTEDIDIVFYKLLQWK